MGGLSNEARAERAFTALCDFANDGGSGFAPSMDELDFDEDLVDLLADLMHLCDKYDDRPQVHGFDHALVLARINHSVEK